jgi:hypothetical protein
VGSVVALTQTIFPRFTICSVMPITRFFYITVFPIYCSPPMSDIYCSSPLTVYWPVVKIRRRDWYVHIRTLSLSSAVREAAARKFLDDLCPVGQNCLDFRFRFPSGYITATFSSALSTCPRLCRLCCTTTTHTAQRLPCTAFSL